MKTTLTELKISPAKRLPLLFAMGVVFLLSAAVTAQASALAYWRMESQITTACNFNGVADSAMGGVLTGNCAAAGATNNPLIEFNANNGNNVGLSSSVPPANMFNAGFSGGSHSYNAESLLNQDGALFFPQDQYGNEFSTPSWTFEMFIQADGNQSGNGIQQLLNNNDAGVLYGLDINESSPGGLRLYIYNGSSYPTLDLTDRNYADGQWHYIVCSYNQPTKQLTIRVRSQNGQVSKNYMFLTTDPVTSPAGNLFLGRNTYANSASPRTFRGLIDEVRVWNNVPPDSALEAQITPSGTNVVAFWQFESVLNFGSATNYARFQDDATSTNQGTGVEGAGPGGAGATASQDYLNIYPGDTGVVLSNMIPPSSMFNAGFSGGTNSYYCQNSTATASFDPARFGDELNTASWTFEMFYKANGNQAGIDTSETNRMQLIENGSFFYGVVANEASAGSLRLFAQQTDGNFKTTDLTDRNYSDGTWQYVVCSYNEPSKILTLRVRSQSGLTSSNSVTLTADPMTTPQILSIGAENAGSGGGRRVRGWMDEVRFSDGVQQISSLIAKIEADSTNIISSSMNPAPFGSSITLTSVVSTVVVGNGTPTGTVQFKTNGVAFGSPVILVGGMATITTSALALGAQTVTAEYAGDGRFYGSTNTFLQTNQGTVTISGGLTVDSKTYDGTTVASISSNNVSLSGILSGDAANVYLSTNGYMAVFSPDATAANGKTVNVSGMTLTGSAAGNYTLIPPSLSGNITPKPLTYAGVSVPSSKVYDGTVTATPTGTATLGTAEAPVFNTGGDGLPYTGDTVSINGLPSASYDSADVASATTVTFTIGSLSLSGSQAGDYSITIEGPQAATITPEPVTVSVTSSENPSAYMDAVSFTATVTSPTPPDGSIIFTTNGVTFEADPLNGGSVTSSSTSSLPRGNNPVTATYAGDANYSGSADLSGAPVAGDQTVTNHPPVALHAAFRNRVQNVSMRLLISDLLTNFTDQDGDILSLSSYDTISTNGTTLADDGINIYYTNSSPGNVNDAFGYQVSDGFGGLSTNEVFITIIQTNGQQSAQINVSGNSVSVTFYGVPDYQYDVQRNTNLGAGAGWVDITNVTTPAGGVFTITDNFTDIVPSLLPTAPHSAYYRLLVP